MFNECLFYDGSSFILRSCELTNRTSLSAGLIFFNFFVAAVIQRSGSLIMTCPLASYTEVAQTVCVKKVKKGKENQ